MTEWTPTQLLALDQLSRKTLTEVADCDPELSALLSAKVSAERRRSLQQAMPSVSQRLREILSKIDLPVGAEDRPLPTLLAEGLAADPEIDDDLAEEAFTGLARLDEAVDDPAEPGVPLREHPLFTRELRRAATARLASAAGLGSPGIAKVLAVAGTPDALTDAALAGLRDNGVLTEDQARILGVGAVLHHLDGELAASLAETLSRQGVSSVEAMVKLDAAAWKEALDRGGRAATDGIEEMAQRLERAITSLRPTDALLSRITAPPAVTRIRRLNPDTELLALDYNESSLDLGDLDAGQRDLAMAHLKAYQRVFALTDDVAGTAALIRSGYLGAANVAADTEERFAQRTGLPKLTAKRFHENARSIVGQLGIATAAIADAIRPALHHTRVDVDDHLKRIPGFATLFGSQDYCQCGHCGSILSPAAYFVDLMSFVDEHVRRPHFIDAGHDRHALDLKTRRPDLWTLPLTCENTTTRVRHLDLVNEVLETYLAKRANLRGRDGVYRRLASAADSFRQPFSLPLAELHEYLQDFGIERSEIVAVMTAATAASTHTAARISLALPEYRLISRENTDPAFLTRIYGRTIDSSGVLLAPLRKFTGLTREDFGLLTESRFVTHAGAEPVHIVSEKSSPQAVQNDVERVYGLRPSVLDRLHRMARLARAVPWTIPQLDLVLTQLGGSLTETALNRVADVIDIDRRFDLPIEQNCALWGQIPAGELLFDTLFNPALPDSGRRLPSNIRYIHPSFRATPSASDSDDLPHRIRAGLGVSDPDLVELIKALAPGLGADLEATDEDRRGFVLSRAHLSLLYRHARLAALLNMPVADLFTLIGIAGIRNSRIGNLADLTTLLSFHDWLATSGYTLGELLVITGAQPPAADAAELAAQLIQRVRADGGLEFADTLFAFLPGVTEAESRAIIAANGAVGGPVFEAVEPTGPTVPTRPPTSGVRLRLRPGFAPDSPIRVPSGVNAHEDDLREMLLQHHVSRIVPTRLVSLLGSPAAGVQGLRELITIAGTDGWEDIAAEMRPAGSANALTGLVAALLPLSVLFKSPIFDAEALAFLRVHHRTVGIGTFAAPDLAVIRQLSGYARLAQTTSDRAALHRVLVTSGGISTADRDQVATTMSTSREMIDTLLPRLPLPRAPLAALAVVQHAVALATRLGIDGQTMADLASDDYTRLAVAASGILGALRASGGAVAEPAEVLERHGDRLAEIRRDALADYLIRSLRAEFTVPADISEHLLVDTDTAGCARTSRVIAATTSVQLYVHRVRLNLEQDRRRRDDPQRVAVPPSAIPDDQWTWRRFYRVWEANRKVFLWPENYLEPSLRDDKTPLFAELESTLLQQQVTDQTVLDAYGSYLSGLDEVAHLRIAGACHEKDPDTETDVLHIFAVTPQDPPVHYYRTVHNAHYGETSPLRHVSYGPWRKVDVSIPVRQVAPVIHRKQLLVFWNELSTSHRNRVVDGSSTFIGYWHRGTTKYTTLRLDGTWSAPQPIHRWYVNDPLSDAAEANAVTEARQAYQRARRISPARRDAAQETLVQAIEKRKIPRYGTEPHSEPSESYALRGFQWDRPYPALRPNGVLLTTRNFRTRGEADFFAQQLVNVYQDRTFSRAPGQNPLLAIRKRPDAVFVGGPPVTVPEGWYGLNSVTSIEFVLDSYAYASIVADHRRLSQLAKTYKSEVIARRVEESLGFHHLIGAVPATARLTVVQGSITDALLDVSGDVIYIQGSVRPANVYVAKRLTTTTVEPMRRLLLTGGVPRLLRLRSQLSLTEQPPPLHAGPDLMTGPMSQGADLRGAFGTYLQEVFFHIPFLLAGHLNAAQRYEEAAHWWRYLFDPTSDESAAGTDRVWRYLGFRGQARPSLRELLTDPQAIAAYQDDPLNPYAIARLRPTAFQKCVVMKYVDNLLDWADSRFSVYTPEAVTEATALYNLAGQVLGPRPEPVGQCGQDSVQPRTYERISGTQISEFLYELENLIFLRGSVRQLYATKQRFAYTADASMVRFFANLRLSSNPDTADAGASQPLTWNKTAKRLGPLARTPDFGFSVVRQIGPAFCVPANPDLAAYWDKVENRLYKLRHCLDIDGVPRQLPLLAPELDPRLLVLARSLGLSIEDVVGSTSGDLPPYRFTYLIDKARQHASAVQSFGSALQSALERKDAEELAQLRAVHQHQLETMNLRVRERELTIADESVAALQRQVDAAEYRRQHFEGLLQTGLNAAEQTQQGSRHAASALLAAGTGLGTAAATVRYVANVGSPFAMTYGGEELGEALKYWSDTINDTGRMLQLIGDSAGLEAGFQRRGQEWRHQISLARHELRQLDKQARVAQLRRQVAQRSLEAHRRQIAQSDEILQLYGDKFSGVGRYSWLAGTLQRLYREAYQSALATARLAEQALRFERGDQSTVLLRGDHFDPGNAGLLAGERLLLDLEAMERRFIETNYRTLEIDQTFSLAQISPAALMRLRQTGRCEFTLPEVQFDLQYPGQYLRRIRSARLTIPCVAGPYVNVPATLTLTGSKLRREPRLTARLVDVPPQRSTTIATSKAQNDAGVFEFSFRDERYMPFEGAGAVESTWRLALPETLRPFNYDTIADVLIHMHYTADHDDAFAEAVQQANATLVGTILHQLGSAPIRRLFRLRQDFASEFQRLTRGERATITMTDRHLPYFIRDRAMAVTSAKLVTASEAATNLEVQVNGTTVGGFTRQADLPGMSAAEATGAFGGGLLGEHVLVPTEGVVPDDLQLLVELRVT